MPLDPRASKPTGRIGLLPLALAVALALGGKLTASSDAKPEPSIPESFIRVP